MPRPRPLLPEQARASLANRLGIKVADRARQLNTKFGLRPTRCWMVWERWTGAERGEGMPLEIQRIELLPTPKVKSLDSVTYSIFHAGTVPEGSVQLSEVSLLYTYDELTGHMVPEVHSDVVPQPYSFWYELVEDGRGDPEPVHQRFRLLAFPRRGPTQWTVMLQKAAEDNNRDGTSAYLTGRQGG
jgi:hypothetical protein